ncbi:aminotransferase class V-fold PLP-dependent enzyme [Robertmurraya massiliosenegalensis]|uniref:aminotransferase class V-fold PLP-dependent enzyme n=1 Tax=Robertmurraya TaxID=2837507 RepID=UPI0039A45DD7
MKSIYMDYACMGKPFRTTLEAISKTVAKLSFLDEPGTNYTIGLFNEIEKTREKIAEFLCVSPTSIAFINNTTHGLGILASTMKINRNENILIPDLEFLSASLVWRERQRRIGFEIRPVSTKNGCVTVEDVDAVIDSKTKAIVVSAVQEVSGYRADLKGLMDVAQKHGSYLLVDGIQEVGVLERDLGKNSVHAYCAGGHKWLGSPFGTGFMFVSPKLLEELEPAYIGYMGLKTPEEGWDTYLKSRERTPFDTFVMVEEAKKLETGGTPNWLGAVGLGHAVDEIVNQGIRKIELEVQELLHVLRTFLLAAGLEDFILGSVEAEKQSGIVTFSLPDGIEQEERFLLALQREKIYVSHRSISGIGGIRVSPYTVHTIADMERLTNVMERFLRKG